MEERLRVDGSRGKGANALWEQHVMALEVARKIELFNSTSKDAVHLQIDRHAVANGSVFLAELCFLALGNRVACTSYRYIF